MTTLLYLLMSLPALVLAFTVHESCHALVADALGDPTARRAGRVTLDPRPHLDPLGTSVLLLSMLLTVGHGPVFGWAKPVEFNPYNLRHPRRDAGLIAAAGPVSNFLMAIVSGLLLRLPMPHLLAVFFLVCLLMNVALGLFNLIPIPPLDGANLLKAILPEQQAYRLMSFERQHGAMLSLVALILFFTVLSGPFTWLFATVVHLLI